MDAAIEDIVDVLGGAAAIHLGDVPLCVVGVAVDSVVGHVACRVVGEAAGRDLIVGRVDRWIEIIARLQRSLGNSIAVEIVTVRVVLHRAGSHGRDEKGVRWLRLELLAGRGETAGPSTTLLTGRDDNSVAGSDTVPWHRLRGEIWGTL